MWKKRSRDCSWNERREKRKKFSGEEKSFSNNECEKKGSDGKENCVQCFYLKQIIKKSPKWFTVVKPRGRKIGKKAKPKKDSLCSMFTQRIIKVALGNCVWDKHRQQQVWRKEKSSVEKYWFLGSRKEIFFVTDNQRNENRQKEKEILNQLTGHFFTKKTTRSRRNKLIRDYSVTHISQGLLNNYFFLNNSVSMTRSHSRAFHKLSLLAMGRATGEWSLSTFVMLETVQCHGTISINFQCMKILCENEEKKIFFH